MTTPSRLLVLIDDVRLFKDRRAAEVARSSEAALVLLHRLDGRCIDELWLDYDLVGDDTSQPVVDHLVARAGRGDAVSISRIEVHSSNVRDGRRILDELLAAGYPARRNFAANIWTHNWKLPDDRFA